MAEFVYVAFYKPFGVLTSFTDDEKPAGERETIKNYVDVPDIYPAGRLDFDSEGLLLLTNDGNLAHRLTDPRYNHPKTYLVQVEGVPTPEALAKLQSGVEVKGEPTRRAQVVVVPEPTLPERRKPVTPHGPTTWLRIVLREGRKHQVRHMTAAVGHPTLRLVRVALGPVGLNELQPGEWRYLSEAEVKLLKDQLKTSRPAERVSETPVRRSKPIYLPLNSPGTKQRKRRKPEGDESLPRGTGRPRKKSRRGTL